ncbi:hypothetical protein DPMN_190319 [Dreissena polymorpha]|uniref:Uncharacterized protein n=1 Tax=Dreissena polymorpha TaxID=45954 RepID=A0A9D4IAA2_DREPO|nr:hypothetical protein DPMN_190319 [Dreissena polymorpha]
MLYVPWIVAGTCKSAGEAVKTGGYATLDRPCHPCLRTQSVAVLEKKKKKKKKEEKKKKNNKKKKKKRKKKKKKKKK